MRCERCGMENPPPDQSCQFRGRADFHYVGTKDGCRWCGRLIEACLAAPCGERRRRKPK